jgi:hypothetical protein
MILLTAGDPALRLYVSIWMRVFLYHRSPHPTAQRPEWN